MLSIEKRKENMILMKALEDIEAETGENLVEQLVESEVFKLTDPKDVSFLIQDSIMGTFSNKNTGEEFKLKNSTVMKLMVFKLETLEQNNISNESLDN